MSKTTKPSNELAVLPDRSKLDAELHAHLRRKEAQEVRTPQPVEKMDVELVNEEVDCHRCGSFFDSQSLMIAGIEAARARYCDDCIRTINAEREIEEEEKRRKQREASFLRAWEVIPVTYREEFNFELLSMAVAKRHAKDFEKGLVAAPFDPAKFKATIHAIRDFPLDGGGVSVIGRTRRGKTRVLVQLLERAARAGESFAYINLAVWGTELSGLMAEDMAKANRSIERLCSVKKLLMDDLGKQRNTERIMSELYRIVETRTNRGLDIYFSANEKGDALIEKMVTTDGQVSDCAEPLVERLRESCKGFAL